MKKTLEGAGEDAIIRSISRGFTQRHPRLLKGIGDDTAVTVQDSSRALLSTVDVLIEGTHFKRGLTTPYLLGRKSLTVSVSDIAAMGGAPLFFLVSIAMPPDTERAFLNGLYRGLREAAKDYGCILAGGNTARTGGPLTVSTTVFGEARKKRVVYRSGARPGDIVYVTGAPGDSALGLRRLMESGIKALRGPFRRVALKHLDPVARLDLSALLASAGLATAMIDISDGVAMDLRRLCIESRAAAVIDTAKLPLSKELKASSDALGLALSGGEDYELLFTTRPEHEAKAAALSKKAGVDVTPVGNIVKGRAGALKILGADGRPVRLKKLGFEHF